MKSYKDVVIERYDGIENSVHPYDNIYSLINPIGFYGDKNIRIVFHKCFSFIRKRGVDITQTKILDIGCGKGGTTRFFSDLAESPQNIFGVDLSKNRIARAIEMNPKINYTVGDVLFPPHFSTNFDIVTAIDIFMHLKSKEDILFRFKQYKKST